MSLPSTSPQIDLLESPQKPDRWSGQGWSIPDLILTFMISHSKYRS